MEVPNLFLHFLKMGKWKVSLPVERCGVMKEEWLIGANDHWVWRFHRDNSAWVRDPKVFIDRGRQMPEGPPLLKERRYLRKDAAEQLWKSLQTQGWKKTRPLWGATAEP